MPYYLYLFHDKMKFVNRTLPSSDMFLVLDDAKIKVMHVL